MTTITIERAAVYRALSALEYHTQQTRPIHNTELVIEELRAALAAPATAPDTDTQKRALENVRVLAARHRHEEWAQHMLRFCDDGAVTAKTLRAAPATAPAQPASKALQDVAAERQRQDAKWGGPKHDDWHSVSDWRRFIACRLNRIPTDAIPPNALPIGTRPKDRQEERKMLIEIGALAVAAAESIDREAGRFRADGFPAWICDACKTPDGGDVIFVRAEPSWQDAPTKPGMWACLYMGELSTAIFNAYEIEHFDASEMGGCRWQFIPDEDKP